MSHDNSQVAHLWANRSKDSARSNNGNFHFSGDTIYSYATPIAKLYPGCVLTTSHTYSKTTSCKHMPAIYRALNSNQKQFYVPSIGAAGGRAYTLGKVLNHADNLKHFQEGFESAVKQWRNVKDEWRLQHLSEHAAGIADAMRDYAECFKLKAKAWTKPYDEFHATRESVLAFRAERDARLNSPAQVAKRAKDQARRDAKRAQQAELARLAEAEKAQTWLTGELDHYRSPYGVPALLRVKGDVLQTSQGATVPLDHAIRAFRFIAIRKKTGEPWETNGHRLPVGSFQIDKIDAAGNITAGCHTIVWPEIERVARDLGILNAPAA